MAIAPRNPRISPAAFSFLEDCINQARDTWYFYWLPSLQPIAGIALAADDQAFAFEPREAFLVAILLSVAFAEWDDLGNRRIAIVDQDSAAGANVIEVAGEAVAQLADFRFLHDFTIIAKLALWRYPRLREKKIGALSSL